MLSVIAPTIKTIEVIIAQIGLFIRPIVIVNFMPWVALSVKFVIFKMLQNLKLFFGKDEN